MREHFCVAPRDESVFLCVSEAAGEFFPAVDVLDFVQKEPAFFVAQFRLHLNDVVEIIQREVGKPLVLKVDVDYLIPIHARSDQIHDKLVKNRRFSCAAKSHDNIICVQIKVTFPRNDFKFADCLVLVKNHFF